MPHHDKRACQPHQRLRLHPTLYEGAKRRVLRPTAVSHPEYPNTESVLLLVDFNARVGADHASWPRCLGRFGIGSINENGKRQLELCTLHDLCITNLFFKLSRITKYRGDIPVPNDGTRWT